jgi:hypothetical protein
VLQRETVVLRAAVTVLLATACGGSKQAAPPTTPGYGATIGGASGSPNYAQNPAYGQPSGAAPYGGQTSYGAAPSTAPPPGQMAPLGSVLSDPTMMQNILAGALAGGAAALGAMTGGEQAPLEQGIKTQAAMKAKGMVADGQLMTARLQQDGHAEASITMQPGACYTVIGFGALGALDFQINIVTAPPMPPQIIAQSNTGSGVPIVGGEGQCIRSPYPIPFVVKIDMHLVRGQALVGAELYKK